jgi:hypothetical protein
VRRPVLSRQAVLVLVLIPLRAADGQIGDERMTTGRATARQPRVRASTNRVDQKTNSPTGSNVKRGLG